MSPSALLLKRRHETLRETANAPEPEAFMDSGRGTVPNAVAVNTASCAFAARNAVRIVLMASDLL